MYEKTKSRSSFTQDKAVLNVWERELGKLSTRNFANRFGASEDLVLRLEIYNKLQNHRGCVNTVTFNAGGDILVSGSDDRRVILWDWETGYPKFSFHSGHHRNVFQAKIMPYTNDRSIVTCAADGEVRHSQISESGKVETVLLAHHNGGAHKLAIEPGSPFIFYTCGEDGLVQHIDLRTGASTKHFTCRPLDGRAYMQAVPLHAITIDPRNPNLFAIAGSDEYTRLYDVRKYNWERYSNFGQPLDYFCPPHLIGNAQVEITGLAFSDQSELLVSYNDDFIYLFTPEMGLGPDLAPVITANDASEAGSDSSSEESTSTIDTDAKSGPQAYKGHRNIETVKGVNFFGPKCEYVVSGSDCGRIFVWRKKGGQLVRVMDADRHVVNCIEPHPHIMVLASSGIENDIKIWIPKALERANLPVNLEQVCRPNRDYWIPFDYYNDDDDDMDGDDNDMDDDDDDDSSDGADCADDGFGDNNDDDDDDDDDGDIHISVGDNDGNGCDCRNL